VIFANNKAVSSLMLGDIVVNCIFVSIYIPLVFFVKKTFGWLFFRCPTPFFDTQIRLCYELASGWWAATCK
jgi:hypothetical protein